MKMYIYKLIDPRTNKIRYIGKTNSLLNRFKNHLIEITIRSARKWNLKRCNWYESLLQDECIPIMEVIEIVTKQNAPERELYWIEFYSKTEDLVNSTFNIENNPYNKTYFGKIVYSFCEHTKQITQYDNVDNAAFKVNGNRHSIHAAIHIKGRHKDLFWGYDPKDFENYTIKPWSSRNLVAVTDKNGITKIYKNASQACESLGIMKSKHNTLTKIRKGIITEKWGYKFEMRASLKPGELLESCDTNQQLSSSNSKNNVEEKVQRLTVEELETNNTDTSAEQLVGLKEQINFNNRMSIRELKTFIKNS